MKLYAIALLLWLPCTAIATDNLLGLPPLKIPSNNPQSSKKIALGKRLFNESRLSQDGSVSCASCHLAQQAFTDNKKVSVGVQGQTGFRNAPTVVNAAFYQRFFLDGRAKSLEEQALGPLLNPVEHGLQNSADIVAIITNDISYQKAFASAFPRSNSGISIKKITRAIASFERTLIAGNSAFDRYLFARDRQALTESEARGMRIFRRKGNCSNCHEISGTNALFMNNRFYNLGIGFQSINAQINDFLHAIRAGQHPDEFSFTPKQRAELGRFNVTHTLKDIGKFKTPTLRNIALTAPYMHDGSIKTLEEVIEYYDQGGKANPFLDPAIFPLHFTPQEKQDLLAFLKSLNSQTATKED